MPEEVYNIYRGQNGVIDFGTIVGTYVEGDSQVVVASQVLDDATWQYAVKAASTIGTCSVLSDASLVTTVVVDSSGDLIEPAGNVPSDLQATAIKGAKVQLDWRYSNVNQDATPTGFKVYRSTDASSWAEQDTVAFALGRGGNYTWTSAALSDGTTYYYLVRTYRTVSAVDHEESNLNFVVVVADSTGPAAITGIAVTED